MTLAHSLTVDTNWFDKILTHRLDLEYMYIYITSILSSKTRLHSGAGQRAPPCTPQDGLEKEVGVRAVLYPPEYPARSLTLVFQHAAQPHSL